MSGVTTISSQLGVLTIFLRSRLCLKLFCWFWASLKPPELLRALRSLKSCFSVAWFLSAPFSFSLSIANYSGCVFIGDSKTSSSSLPSIAFLAWPESDDIVEHPLSSTLSFFYTRLIIWGLAWPRLMPSVTLPKLLVEKRLRWWLDRRVWACLPQGEALESMAADVVAINGFNLSPCILLSSLKVSRAFLASVVFLFSVSFYGLSLAEAFDSLFCAGLAGLSLS